MIEINKNPSSRDLLVFAALLPIVFGVAGAFRWHAGSARAAVALWLTGILVALVVSLIPPARRWLYLGWMYAIYPIAWAVSLVILFVVYLIVVTPVALALRALGRDPMQRGFDKDEKSYWILRQPNRSGARYFRQF